MTIFIEDVSELRGLDQVKIFKSMRKADIINICRLLMVKANVKETKAYNARILAEFYLKEPEQVLEHFGEESLQIIHDIMFSEEHCAVRPLTYDYYKVQNFGLVVTYEDPERNEWKMWMPEKTRMAYEVPCRYFLKYLQDTGKHLNKKRYELLRDEENEGDE